MRTVLAAVGCLLVLAGCAGQSGDRRLVNQMGSIGLSASETDRGVVVNLPNVYFEYDSARLTLDARQKLREMAGLLSQEEVAERGLAVEGHTDSKGEEDYNQNLSERRAKAVARELVLNKIRGDRIVSRGFGEARPVASNENADGSDNPEGRAQNRRVEVVIEDQVATN